MNRTIKTIILTIAAVAGTAGAALAQTTPTFSILVTQKGVTTEIPEGGTITFASDGIGIANPAVVTITNRTNAAIIFEAAQQTGSSDFALSATPELPYTLSPRAAISFNVTQTATVSTRTTGQVQLGYTTGSASRSLAINLVGTAPEFTYSYTPQGGNATAIVTGGSILFPATPIDATSTATVVATNRGTAPGKISSIGVSGSSFLGVGLPLPDTQVDAGKDLKFTVSFTPKSLEQSQGTLTIATPERQNTFRLEGSGQGSTFSYETEAGPLRPGGTVAVPDVNVGEKSTMVVRVRNTGNFEGKISTLTISGTGYTLTETPVLPLTLPAGGSFAFTINFAPTVPGRAGARLRIGVDDFEVTGNGLGATLSYNFAIGSVTSPVNSGGAINVPPTAVGATATVQFTVQNTGTAASVVNTIGLGTAATTNPPTFALSGLPALPLTLQPDATASFTIVFTPSVQGSATNSLRVDNATFTLNAFGNAPAPLPAIRYDGASGAQEPLTQPAVGLSLASAYALPLNGTLTLAFNSDVFTNDPSVQFATGGRTVNFTIPAGQTRAVFPNNQSTIRVQTGTIAGTITLTPSFLTEGGINLTPTNPPAQNLTIAAAAPRILGVVLSARTVNTITLLVSGYTTARSVTSMELQFTAVSGESLSTTRLTVPVEPAFLGWYQSVSAVPFGSLFSVSVPLTLQGDVTGSGLSLSDTIQSVSVVLSNRLGSSPAVSLNLR